MTFRNTAHGGNQGGHQRNVPQRNLGPGSPDWVPATAEDEPPASARSNAIVSGRTFLSIAVRIARGNDSTVRQLQLVPI